MTERGEGRDLQVRVGHDERDACFATLLHHHMEGRLSVEELDRRQSAVLNAVTAADLSHLLADLPSSSDVRQTQAVRSPDVQRVSPQWPDKAARVVGPAAVFVAGGIGALRLDASDPYTDGYTWFLYAGRWADSAT